MVLGEYDVAVIGGGHAAVRRLCGGKIGLGKRLCFQ